MSTQVELLERAKAVARKQGPVAVTATVTVDPDGFEAIVSNLVAVGFKADESKAVAGGLRPDGNGLMKPYHLFLRKGAKRSNVAFYYSGKIVFTNFDPKSLEEAQKAEVEVEAEPVAA